MLQALHRGISVSLCPLLLRWLLQKKLKGCTSYEDLNKTTITNIISSVSGPTTFGVQPPLKDPKERKRQRERDRYAQLSSDQKNELLRKRREARQKKKVAATHVNAKHHGQTISE
ncbi:hypothetical protein U9M48_008588 [Paspalum notatum var. saurae]|uniref:Uncharacterized protein n=1 Tax=Paspalum notatum var. saurae TaxID=547442 RepID=A0AAQ3SPC4_PASNO